MVVYHVKNKSVSTENDPIKKIQVSNCKNKWY